VKLDFPKLVRAAEANEMGKLRDHFTACDGFEAAQDMARMIDSLANRNAIVLWSVLQNIHKWQR
jgi:hypothetical protein